MWLEGQVMKTGDLSIPSSALRLELCDLKLHAICASVSSLMLLFSCSVVSNSLRPHGLSTPGFPVLHHLPPTFICYRDRQIQYEKMHFKSVVPGAQQALHIYLFTFLWGCLGPLLLQCRLSLVATSRVYSRATVCGLLTVVASLVVEHGFQGLQAQWS